MECGIEDLIGKTIISVDRYDDKLIFVTENETYTMLHEQDCCEGVCIDDINGDLLDLIDTPILQASEETNVDSNPENVPIKEYQDSWTWTFYKLATIKGYVTIRWYGESNGYYSESVSIIKS